MSDTAQVSEEYAALLGVSADEVEEVSGPSDFPPVWDFKQPGKEKLVGIYRSVKKAGKKNSNLYTFEVDGEEITFWGTAVLDSRMKSVDFGDKALVHRTGEFLNTSSGNPAAEFKVLVARSAIR